MTGYILEEMIEKYSTLHLESERNEYDGDVKLVLPIRDPSLIRVHSISSNIIQST